MLIADGISSTTYLDVYIFSASDPALLVTRSRFQQVLPSAPVYYSLAVVIFYDQNQQYTNVHQSEKLLFATHPTPSFCLM